MPHDPITLELASGPGNFMSIAANATAGTVVDTFIIGGGHPPYDIKVVDEEGLPGYDVFLSFGSSNVFWGKTLNPALDISNPRIFQWGREAPNDNTVILATEPLEHVAPDPVRIGFTLAFLRDFYIPNGHLIDGRDILIIPAARFDTGFVDNTWNPGDAGYNDVVTRTNLAMALDPGTKLNIFKGFLWHQGEDDINTGLYDEKLDAMFAGLRAAITGASNASIVVGGMPQDWTANNKRRINRQSTIRGTKERFGKCTYADPEFPTSILEPSGTELKFFSDVEQRLFAERYFDAFLESQDVCPTLPATFTFDSNLRFHIRFKRGLFEDTQENADVVLETRPFLIYELDRGLVMTNDTTVDTYLNTDIFEALSYTKTGWFKRFSQIDCNIFSGNFEQIGTTGNTAVRFRGNNIEAGHYDGGSGGYDAVSAPVSLNTLYHWAVTYNHVTQDMILYLNGVQVDSGTDTVGVRVAGKVLIGGIDTNGGDNFQDCYLDDLRYYNIPLTAPQIAEIFAGDVPVL